MLRLFALAVAVAWVTTAFVYIAFSKSIVEAIYHGRSVGILNHIVASHRNVRPETRDLAYFQYKRTSLFVGVSLIFGLCEAYLILEMRRSKLVRTVKETIRTFFKCAGHPVNLAIFRIVFFGFWAW